MHDIQVTAPKGKGDSIAALALTIGIQQASFTSLYLHGPNRPADQISVDVSTPQAKAFVGAIFALKILTPKPVDHIARAKGNYEPQSGARNHPAHGWARFVCFSDRHCRRGLGNANCCWKMKTGFLASVASALVNSSIV